MQIKEQLWLDLAGSGDMGSPMRQTPVKHGNAPLEGLSGDQEKPCGFADGGGGRCAPQGAQHGNPFSVRHTYSNATLFDPIESP